MNFSDRTASALAHVGIGLCEHFVMCQVGYRTGCAPDDLARDSWHESAGDCRGQFLLSEHRAAVVRCLDKGLLMVLSADEAECEHRRCLTSGLPELIDFGVKAGALVFTRAGFGVHRSVITAVFGEATILRSDSGWNHLEDRHRFEVFAPTLDVCRAHVDDLTREVGCYCGVPAVVTAVVPPEAIGPWRPNRFVLYPDGYRAAVAYLPHEGG